MSRRRVEIALAAIPTAILLVGAWIHRWMSDDGFIYLRVVQNVVAGHGPVFNQGERVEAATGPLWTALLAIGDLVLPIRLEWIAVLLGIALAVTALVVLMVGSARIWRSVDAEETLVPMGALVIAVIPAMWDYSTSGLETALALAWIGALFLVAARWVTATPPRADRVPVTLAMLAGLGPLIRPDLAILSVAVLAVLLVWPGPHRLASRARVLGLWAVVPLAYEAFRMGYYAALVPNPAFTKESAVARWPQGFRYLRDFVAVYWLWVPALAVAAGIVILLLRVHTAGQLRRRGRSSSPSSSPAS